MMILPLAAAILACGGSSDSTGPGTGGGGGGGGTTPVATTAVTMASRAFSPPAIRVAAGATVTWTNSDGEAHNVTFANAAVPASGTIAGGANKALVMPAVAGTYNYTCTFHSGMNGSVQVQ
ncbi:MAG: plastocyanin/azurin family copper-binding protein [Gemmatimonadaceae bacterium]